MTSNIKFYLKIVLEFWLIISAIYAIQFIFPALEASGAVSGAALMVSLFTFNLIAQKWKK